MGCADLWLSQNGTLNSGRALAGGVGGGCTLQDHAEVQKAGAMVLSVKGFRDSSSCLSLVGSTDPAENLLLPHWHSSCWLRVTALYSYPGSRLGVTLMQSFTYTCKDRPNCQQALPFGASGSQRKLRGGWRGLQLFAVALAFSAPKRAWGAVTLSEIADGWSHLILAICGMTVLGAMLFIIAVVLNFSNAGACSCSPSIYI